jgi:hypothetical protein
MPEGAIVDFQRVYDLSHDWYGGRMDLDWHRPDAAHAQALLRGHGLDGPFWELT